LSSYFGRRIKVQQIVLLSQFDVRLWLEAKERRR
jgi:hypothetical protein